MADSGENTIAWPVFAANPRIIRVTVKTPMAKEEFVVPENSTIKQFKEEISKHFNCQTSQLVLVFMGRILKDQDTLRQHGIQDGITVHLVIRTQKRPQDQQLPQMCMARNGAPTPAPSTLNSAFNVSRRCPDGKVSSTDLQSQLQLMASSEMLGQKVENPFIQSMLSNPDLMRQLIMAHPQMQQLAQQIPEISRILNNADLMREMLDIVRNPEKIQEMRSQDRALSNLENIPGGDNALRCTYAELQEPVLSATQEQFGTNPFASLVRNPSMEGVGLGGQPSCVDDRDLSAPPSVSQSATSVCTESTCGDLDSSVSSSCAGPAGQSSSTPSLGPGRGTGLLNTGGIQSLVQQITENPQLIVNLCASYTKCMMLSLIQNTQLAARASFSAENPQHQERVTQRLPNFFQQIQNPEMLVAMSNPKAMQAWLQIEQGLQTLSAEAPVLLPWFTLRLWGLGNSGSSLSATGARPAPSETSRPASTASEPGHQHLNMLRMLKVLPGTNPQHLQVGSLNPDGNIQAKRISAQEWDGRNIQPSRLTCARPHGD
uniref:Ubiquitin-like domain-containing protein n=1 Tax=Pelusios castaneus TaxID=367368 RepID=A0A8C8RG22_9SAUR